MKDKDIKEILELKDCMLINHKNWRKGQALFNAIYRIHPEIANEIRATDIDPFHSDDRIEACLEFLRNRKE